MMPAGFTVTRNDMSAHFTLRGEEGAVTYHYTTFPSGAVYTSLDYHSRRPMFVGQKPYDCNFIGDGPYCDGTSMIAIDGDEKEIKSSLMNHYRKFFFERE